MPHIILNLLLNSKQYFHFELFFIYPLVEQTKDYIYPKFMADHNQKHDLWDHNHQGRASTLNVFKKDYIKEQDK